MIIHVAQVSEAGSSYQGEEPGEVLELEKDHFAHSAGGVAYDLAARRVTGELVVTGTLSAPVRLLCGRCGGFFSTSLRVSSFLRAYPLSGSVESVDLTQDIREDILLEMPAFPRCPWKGERGVCPQSGVDLDVAQRTERPADDSRWSALNNLHIE